MTEYLRRGWRRVAKTRWALPLAALALDATGLWLCLAQGPDADNDGMSDAFETFFGLDPNSAPFRKGKIKGLT